MFSPSLFISSGNEINFFFQRGGSSIVGEGSLMERERERQVDRAIWNVWGRER